MSLRLNLRKSGMHRRWACFLCGLLFSSCATMPSGAGRNLAARIEQHSFVKRKVVILGEGVSPEAADSTAGAARAMVLYCPSYDAGARKSPRLSRFMRDVREGLRAMTASGDYWEVAVAERTRSQVMEVLASMRTQELAAFQGKLVLADRARTDLPFQAQLKRVFGEGVCVEYVRASVP